MSLTAELSPCAFRSIQQHPEASRAFSWPSSRRHQAPAGLSPPPTLKPSTHTLHLTLRQSSNTYSLAKILYPETPEPSIIDSSFKTMGPIMVCQNRRYEAFCVSSLLIRPPRFCQTSLTMSDRDIPPLITMSR